MSLFLTLAFLFFIGSVFGWVLECLFRRFISSANPERKWINPGFCKGPYLPLYGCGLCILFLITLLENLHIIGNPVGDKLLLFAVMSVCMTLIEYIAGILSLKVAKVRLWDYRNEWGNIQGIICPKFSLIWTALGAVYYFLIHSYILDALAWLSGNLAFSFVIGLFFGFFIIDVAESTKIFVRIKKYADDNDVIVRYEMLKANIRKKYDAGKRKYHFFHPFRTELPLNEYLKELKVHFEKRKHK